MLKIFTVVCLLTVFTAKAHAIEEASIIISGSKFHKIQIYVSSGKDIALFPMTDSIDDQLAALPELPSTKAYRCIGKFRQNRVGTGYVTKVYSIRDCVAGNLSRLLEEEQ